jgi:hypothetical protein
MTKAYPLEFAIFKKDFLILLELKDVFSRYYFIPLTFDSVGFVRMIR